MPHRLLFLPPATPTIRQWAAHVAAAVPALQVVVADSVEEARRELPGADAAFGTLPPDLLPTPGSSAGCRRRPPRRPPATTIPSWSATR
jgi:hypothetical protein